jgi:hypothetical protein
MEVDEAEWDAMKAEIRAMHDLLLRLISANSGSIKDLAAGISTLSAGMVAMKEQLDGTTEIVGHLAISNGQGEELSRLLKDERERRARTI